MDVELFDMEIIKNLKDYAMTTQEKIFTSFIKESIASYSCAEKITNPDYIKLKAAPKNNFLIYATGEADPRLLLRRAF